VAAERQRECADDQDQRFQYAVIVAGVGAKFNSDEFWPWSAGRPASRATVPSRWRNRTPDRTPHHPTKIATRARNTSDSWDSPSTGSISQSLYMILMQSILTGEALHLGCHDVDRAITRRITIAAVRLFGGLMLCGASIVEATRFRV